MDSVEAKWLWSSLKTIKFFSGISVENIDAMLQKFQKISVKPGKAIIREGKPGKGFYIIYNGSVEVVKGKFLWFGKRVALLTAGSFFGEMSLILEQPTSASIIALAPSELFVLYKEDFRNLAAANAQFAAEIKAIAENRDYDTYKKIMNISSIEGKS